MFLMQCLFYLSKDRNSLEMWIWNKIYTMVLVSDMQVCYTNKDLSLII